MLIQKEVNKVLYPALPDDPGYKIWKKDFKGASGLFGVVLKNTKKELIYNFYNNPEKLKGYLEVNSVKYLDLDDLKRIFRNKDNMCMGCINGDYSIDKRLEW